MHAVACATLSFGAQHLIDRLRCWVRRPLIFQSRLSPPLRRDALGHQAVGAAERFAWLTPELDPRGADEIGTKSTTVKIAAAIYVRCRGSMSAIVLGPHSDRWKRTASVGATPSPRCLAAKDSCPTRCSRRVGRPALAYDFAQIVRCRKRSGRAACTLARSPYFVTAIRGLQTFRHLHACPGGLRRERSPGGPCTH